jgi:catechol 2,3-dioxygenase-like lactoylglutathione lyase family enzyme
MLANAKAYNGFAVDDLERAREFYEDTLGLRTTPMGDEHLMTLHLPGDRDTLVYVSPSFAPATYTILNFEVEDIDGTVDALSAVRALRGDGAGREGDLARRARHRVVQGPGGEHPVGDPGVVERAQAPGSFGAAATS